jgi:hypothetical protein
MATFCEVNWKIGKSSMIDPIAFVKVRSSSNHDLMQSVLQARENIRKQQRRVERICIEHTHIHIRAVKVTETDVNKHRADPE